MKNNNDAVDKALDALIGEASSLIIEKEGTDVPVIDVEFSKEHTQKMNRLFRKERRKRALRRASRFAGRAACVLVVIVGLMSITLYVAEAWRQKFLNFFFEPEAPNTVIEFAEEKKGEIYEDMAELEYVPKGFSLTESEASRKRVFLTFTDKDRYFQFRLSKYGLDTKVDTEGASAENILINGCEGIYVSKPGLNILVWHDNTYNYRIMSDIEKNEMVKIAENVKIK